MRPITFAHRGARKELPENTVPAFQRALELGAGGLEADAWLSADGDAVLVHDPSIRRGLRWLRVARTSTAALAAAGVPRLTDLYETLGTDFELSVDVKDSSAAEVVIATAHHYDAAPRLWVCSPDVSVLEPWLAHESGVKLVHSERKHAIGKSLERHVADLAALGIDALNMHYSDWSAGLVSLLHRFEVRAFAWDTQETRHLLAMLRIGIDGVYCDRPERMVAVVNEFSP